MTCLILNSLDGAALLAFCLGGGDGEVQLVDAAAQAAWELADASKYI